MRLLTKCKSFISEAGVQDNDIRFIYGKNPAVSECEWMEFAKLNKKLGEESSIDEKTVFLFSIYPINYITHERNHHIPPSVASQQQP